MILRCSSAEHASRSTEPDWRVALGEADRQVDGMVCAACARLDIPSPAEAPVTMESLKTTVTALQAEVKELRKAK